MHTPTFCPELTHHAVSYVVPMEVEQTSRGERATHSLLSKNRIVFAGTPIDDSVGNLIVAQLLYLAQNDPTTRFRCTSTPRWCAGRRTGHIRHHAPNPAPGRNRAHRDCLQHGCGALGGCQRQAVRILIHQASAGVQGIAADIESARREILRLNARLKELMAAGAGQSLDQISHDINRDYWMNAHEAKDCGVVDMIVGQTAATAPADRVEAALITSPRGSASRARPAR